MPEQQYGRQILAEAHYLSSAMKARKPKYGSRELPYLIKQYIRHSAPDFAIFSA
ncbi:hypothetical protein [Aeromonas media]|uniref:hypothetical protein n=1 Tax=Aeromonas media TaxID=651 RepID=UPI000444E70C|nr:hypothetical protein B224_1597 [Aeromonas media WS]